ncbi:MAG: hypothetical protein ACPLYX_01785 [Rectinema subterraneum]|uniref:hypothetical protein n=1 Tax=Rectinema subterraneum TaxID=2653714 RepID=UPI003C7D98A4
MQYFAGSIRDNDSIFVSYRDPVREKRADGFLGVPGNTECTLLAMNAPVDSREGNLRYF